MTQTAQSLDTRVSGWSDWPEVKNFTLFNYLAGEFKGKADIQFREQWVSAKSSPSHADMLKDLLMKHRILYVPAPSLIYVDEGRQIPMPKSRHYRTIAAGLVGVSPEEAVFMRELDILEPMYRPYAIDKEKLNWIQQNYPGKDTTLV